MAMRRMHKPQVKKLSKPTSVFKKSAKKPEPDDTPGKMRGGKRRSKKLEGMML